MTAIIGDNSTINATAKAELKSFVDRIERLNESKGEITADTKEVYTEAKDRGFDVKIIRKVVKLRSVEHARINADEERALVDLYMNAVGWS